MTIRDEDVNAIVRGGGEVRTSQGDKVGKIGQIYLDDESGRPSWVTVKTGLFGTQESFVPLPGAELDGVDVVVSYDKETIKGAPRVDSDGSLTPQEEKLLYSYYFEAQTLAAPGDRDEDVPLGASPVARSDERGHDDRSNDRDTDDDRTGGREGDADRGLDRGLDRGGERGGDDEGTGQRVGTPRLRRYVVTEEVVPVSREEVPVEDTDRR